MDSEGIYHIQIYIYIYVNCKNLQIKLFIGKFIPSTQRPDGTWRKARRVKEGYVPPEEVPLYESKGKMHAQSRRLLPPGLYCTDSKPKVIKNGETVTRCSDSASNKAYKSPRIPAGVLKVPPSFGTKLVIKEPDAAMFAKTSALLAANKNKDNAEHMNTKKSTTTAIKKSNKGNKSKKHQIEDDSKHKLNSLVQDLENIDIANTYIKSETDDINNLRKQIKKLTKKIREIDGIEMKLASGVIKDPPKDQLDKIKRKKEYQIELNQLEQQIDLKQKVTSDND